MQATGGGDPGRWEKVSALEMASTITVELKKGDRIHGQFRGLSASALELLNPAGRAVIPKTDIQTVNLPSKDGLGDGAWKGAAVGAAVGGGLTLIGIATVEESTKTDTAFQGLILGALLTGIGVGLGIAVDAATETEDTVLYKAPQLLRVPRSEIRKGNHQGGPFTEINGHPEGKKRVSPVLRGRGSP